ncbi:NAD-dependent epimerase [Halorhodospira halochloris]|uniref:NAD-dependent epimerase n=1 Tax=Halorhodospira halochloris TaxID=1052 RepID=UPI001EE7E943|nr:NAD-dependent epimerase [Halorhodospira halochloris]MCG5531215.1 NAD-dependent epimerase [Halorhodospira halochloris]
MTHLVTGAAGFIGYHTACALLERGDTVVGLDNLNPYYDPTLKEARLARLRAYDNFRFVHMDLADREGMAELFRSEGFQRVIHLAAQAGVRHSLTDPYSYVDSNVMGTLNVLEGCRYNGVEHLTFASTSSVYGSHTDMPFSVHRHTDHPLAIYAATKKATEHMAHSYAHLYRLPCTGLRFFTVYGPWGRPDMALFLFTRSMLAGEPIDIYNHGNHRRDFTYVDDIVDGVIRASDRIAAPEPSWDPTQPDTATSDAPWRLYNIGAAEPVPLMRFVEVLEKELGIEAEKRFHPLQPGDVPETHADVSDLTRDTGYQPQVSVEEGVKRFVEWYRWYHQV